MNPAEERETLLLQAAARWPDKVMPLLVEMGVAPTDFVASKAHRRLFKTMAALYLDGRVLTEDAVRGALGEASGADAERVEASRALAAAVFGERPEAFDRDPLDFRRTARDLLEESFRLGAIDILLDASARLRAGTGDHVKTVNGALESLVELKKMRRSDRGGDATEELEHLRGLQLKPSTKLVGLDTGYPLLNDRLGGIERELYALGGGTGMGKTTFLTQLAFQLLQKNPGARIVYFALDMSRRDILVKFLSELSLLPARYVKNPAARNRLLAVARFAAIDALARLSDRLVIHDEARGGIEIAEIENEVRKARLEHEGELVVLIDTILAIKGREPLEDRLKRLKTLCRQEKAACIVSFNLRAEAELARPSRYDLATTGPLFYEPYTALTLYCDHIVDKDTPLIEWEWGTQDMMVPIVELNVVKNKMSAFCGRLYYRYLNTLASFRECVQVEVDNYDAIIGNLAEAETRRARKS